MLFPASNLNKIFKSFSLNKGIISIWGDFGVGKTTFALQTAINTIKNANKIIYIYSKPNFPAEKIKNLVRGSRESLNNIIFIQTENFEDVYNIVFNLEFLILNSLNITKEKYKLIVIDSLTGLYRLALNKAKKEQNYNLNYTLNQILANLLNINISYDIEILIVNEKVNMLINNQIIEIQSGGKVMDYWVPTNIKIERTKILKERRFLLTKRPEIQNMEFKSRLTENGFQ